MNCSGVFADVAPRPRYPIVLKIAPAPLKRAGKHRASMPMATQLSSLFHPENIGERSVPHIKCQMANIDIFDERHVRRLFFARADVHVRARIFERDCFEAAGCVDLRHIGLHLICANGLTQCRANVNSAMALLRCAVGVLCFIGPRNHVSTNGLGVSPRQVF